MRLDQLTHTPPDWIEPEMIPPDVDLATLDVHPLIATILYRRGIRDAPAAKAFLDRRRRHAPDHLGLPNIERAVTRIGAAIERGERVGVFGDYDVDGITSTAMLVQALRSASRDDAIFAALPERADGYGVSRHAIDTLANAAVTLLIAVDCGSSDHDHVAYAQSRGMDVVILDHHHMADCGPERAITVSPQLDASGRFHELTTAGIVYLAISALAQSGYAVAEHQTGGESGFLDLVALGTVADVAPLTGVNRALVRDGIAALQRTARPGLDALIRSAEIDRDTLRATDIAFRLAPRLNAAGRLASPHLAFDLLMAEDRREADRIAVELNKLNHTRRIKTDELMANATLAITRLADWQTRSVFLIANEHWESGLLGPVASRLVEKFRRPVFVFRNDDGILHGSGRSVAGFSLVEALEGASSLLTRFGGHSLAAGAALEESNLAALQLHMEGAITVSGLTIPSPVALTIDADLEPVDLEPRTVHILDRLEPFGKANDVPRFRLRDVQVLRYSAMGRENTHLKLLIQTGNRQIEVVGWGTAWRSHELVRLRQIDIVGRLDINRWNGRERLQMVLEDFRPAS